MVISLKFQDFKKFLNNLQSKSGYLVLKSKPVLIQILPNYLHSLWHLTNLNELSKIKIGRFEIAKIKDLSFKEIEEITIKNTKKLFFDKIF